jgi:hypothetical protein
MRTVSPDTLPPPRTGIADEHRALESELFELAHRLTDDRLADAAFTFAALKSRLLDHMALEEETMFPILDSFLDGESGPAAPLRREHGEIRDLLGETGMAIATGDRGAALGALGRLATRLGEHWDREDRLLDPLVTSATSAFER